MEDLSTIIEDSLTDATLPTPEVDLDTPSEPLEASPELTEAPIEEPASIEVPNPAVRAEQAVKTPEDDFDKKFGLTAQSASGRENRIPYTRVKKITEKAINDAKTGWQKDLETSHVPTTKYAEIEAKAKDYEGKIVAYEQSMLKDPAGFLQRLYSLPGYSQVFESLVESARKQALDQFQAQGPAQPQAPIPDDMPGPDETLSDGSKVYSLEGLKGLLAWQDQKTATRTVKQVMDQVNARYGSLEKDYNTYQQRQAALPQVQQQIAEARQWPLFNESEDDIVKALADNPTFSLERAYQQVVLPKLKAEQDRLSGEAKVNRDSIRAEVLAELKRAPRSTSASVGSTRPAPVQANSGGNRSLEDVISDSIKGLK